MNFLFVTQLILPFLMLIGQDGAGSDIRLPLELVGEWRLEAVWEDKENMFVEIKPRPFCRTERDTITLNLDGVVLRVMDIMVTPSSDKTPIEKRMMKVKSQDGKTETVFRVQSNNRGTWLLQVYDDGRESFRAKFKVFDQRNELVLSHGATNLDPAMGYRWPLDPKELTGDKIDDLDLSQRREVDERLFLFYVLGYVHKQINNSKDLGYISSVVSAKRMVVAEILPYLIAAKFDTEIIQLFEDTKSSCDVILSTIEEYGRVAKGREARTDKAVVSIELDLLSDVIGPVAQVAIGGKKHALATLGSQAMSSLSKAYNGLGDAIERENNITLKMDKSMALAIRHEAEVCNKIRAVSSFLGKKYNWRPGESGWSNEEVYPIVDFSNDQLLRTSLARLESLLNQQPQNPFLRAEYNRVAGKLQQKRSYEYLMSSSAFALESSRLIPDGDIYLAVKVPFIEYAAGKIEDASELLVGQLGGWGGARTYNGVRELRVLHAWLKCDRADISGKIRTHWAWAYADLGNIEEARNSLAKIIDLIPMTDAEFFYRAARLRSLEAPSSAFQLLKVAAEIDGERTRRRARDQKEFRWINKWNSSEFQQFIDK